MVLANTRVIDQEYAEGGSLFLPILLSAPHCLSLDTEDCLGRLFERTLNGGMIVEAQVFALLQLKAPPIGHLDSVLGSPRWALAPNTPTNPITINLYLDSPSDQSAFVAAS
jgi:hypothetical protein